MDIYALYRNFWDFSFENPEKIKPNHIAVYCFAVEHCNRLGWKKKFGYPTAMVMDAVGIKNYRTYINSLNDLVDYGFIEMIEKSKNQYSANIIALVNFTNASAKALDKASIKHSTKQRQSTVSIDKQIYNTTNIQIQKSDFIKIWNEVRESVLKKPSHLNRLSLDQTEMLNGIKEIDLRNALIGFFKQKIFPNGQDYTTNTKHFLNHFDNYLQAYYDKKDNIYGKPEL